MGYTNGHIGYFPKQKAYAEGVYESRHLSIAYGHRQIYIPGQQEGQSGNAAQNLYMPAAFTAS